MYGYRVFSIFALVRARPMSSHDVKARVQVSVRRVSSARGSLARTRRDYRPRRPRRTEVAPSTLYSSPDGVVSWRKGADRREDGDKRRTLHTYRALEHVCAALCFARSARATCLRVACAQVCTYTSCRKYVWIPLTHTGRRPSTSASEAGPHDPEGTASMCRTVPLPPTN